MQLDSRQLAAFAAVLREGSFEAAARSLHVTPSAVSQRIKALEERLGRVLIRRASPCVATEAGESLQRHAQQLQLLEAYALACVVEREDNYRGTHSIGDVDALRTELARGDVEQELAGTGAPIAHVPHHTRQE